MGGGGGGGGKKKKKTDSSEEKKNKNIHNTLRVSDYIINRLEITVPVGWALNTNN